MKEQLAQLQVTGAETPGGVELVSPAIPPTSPSSPKPLRDGGIALVIGLLLGVGAAFAAEYFDDKVYTKDEAERLSAGVPVLAIIPTMKKLEESKRPMLITEEDPFSPVTEAYRSLRTSLQFAGHDDAAQDDPGHERLGRRGKDLDGRQPWRGPGQGRRTGRGRQLRPPPAAPRGIPRTHETPGFTSVLLGQEDLKDAIQLVG